MTEKKAEGKIEKFARLCRAAVPEGITLLETDGALPLRENESVAMFGRGQFEYVKSGTGSGRSTRSRKVSPDPTPENASKIR